jgi:hypothetical protein
LVLLALWMGISVGYHDGVRAERLLCEATAQSNHNGIASLKNKPANLSVQLRGPVYRNPHRGVVRMVYVGKTMVNVPDPRTYEQFKEPSR